MAAENGAGGASCLGEVTIESGELPSDIVEVKSATDRGVGAKVCHICALGDLAKSHPLAPTSNQDWDVWFMNRLGRDARFVNLEMLIVEGETVGGPQPLNDFHDFVECPLTDRNRRTWQTELRELLGVVAGPEPQD